MKQIFLRKISLSDVINPKWPTSNNYQFENHIIISTDRFSRLYLNETGIRTSYPQTELLWTNTVLIIDKTVKHVYNIRGYNEFIEQIFRIFQPEMNIFKHICSML